MGMSEVVNFLAEKWFRVEHWPLFASGSPECDEEPGNKYNLGLPSLAQKIVMKWLDFVIVLYMASWWIPSLKVNKLLSK